MCRGDIEVFDITNPRYNEQISLVPCHLFKSLFHCIQLQLQKVSTSHNCFSYHVVFFDVSAHGNVQLVGNCARAVLIVTSGTCIVDCWCVRLQKNWCEVLI